MKSSISDICFNNDDTVVLKEAFLNLAKNSMTFSDYFLDTIKNQDDLSSIEGRSVVAKFALPLVNKITNATLKEAYVNEISNICDLDFAKLIKGEKKNIVPATIKEQNTETKSSSVLRKSILNIFMSLIQHPKLASSGEFNQIRSNSRSVSYTHLTLPTTHCV